jgi:hypothetical protein
LNVCLLYNSTQDISAAAPNRLEPEHTDRLLQGYVVDNVIEVIGGFFSHTQFNQIPSPQLRAPTYKSLYAKVVQLYHCSWLSELQKTSVSLAINAMQEKASFLGCVGLL